MRYLDTVGPVELHLDEASRDIVMVVRTEFGAVSASLTAEKACQLGVCLIRESGKRYVFQQERPNKGVPLPQEEPHAPNHDRRVDVERRAIVQSGQPRRVRKEPQPSDGAGESRPGKPGTEGSGAN